MDIFSNYYDQETKHLYRKFKAFKAKHSSYGN